MWIMTQYGWRKLQVKTVDQEITASERIKNGYIARDLDKQWAELASSVTFKD